MNHVSDLNLTYQLINHNPGTRTGFEPHIIIKTGKKHVSFCGLSDECKVKIIEQKCLVLHALTGTQIRYKTRKREIVVTRQLIMYFVHQFTKLSLAKNGALVGKNHATVLHAIKTITNLAETDKQFRAKLERIKDEIEKS
jgi:chromosomal replication initiation ATPase DnaA